MLAELKMLFEKLKTIKHAKKKLKYIKCGNLFIHLGSFLITESDHWVPLDQYHLHCMAMTLRYFRQKYLSCLPGDARDST